MIKIFTTNKNNKIELTKEELKELLDQAYWEGYRANSNSWTYTSPSITSPYIWTTNNGSSYVLTYNSTANTTEEHVVSNVSTDTPTI